MTLTQILITSDDVVSVPVPDVIVRVFDLVGNFLTSGTTGTDGIANFDLPEADYNLTFFRFGVSMLEGMPQRITVDINPAQFQIPAHVATLPEAIDPLQCRVSGFILGADGEKTKDIRLSMGMCPEIAVLSGTVIAPQQIIDIRPDEEGYYEFNVLRKTKYRVYFPQLITLFNVEPAQVISISPNLPAIRLNDFLFPVPVDAAFSALTLTATLGTDPDSSISCTITYSDGSLNDDGIRLTPPFFTGVEAVSDNVDVAVAAFSVDKLIITPKGTGTCNVIITRQISTTLITYNPLPDFTTDILVVTII